MRWGLEGLFVADCQAEALTAEKEGARRTEDVLLQPLKNSITVVVVRSCRNIIIFFITEEFSAPFSEQQYRIAILSSLYIIATPIGNLADITLRAIETLKSVDVIAAEDTRYSQRLLLYYGIHTPCFSLHDFNEDSRIEKIFLMLSTGKSVALISDAGTPLISDPGFRLVRAVQKGGFAVVPVPGACAAIAALSASGLPTDRFIFEGFLPVKAGALESRLQSLKDETRTIIFYESV